MHPPLFYKEIVPLLLCIHGLMHHPLDFSKPFHHQASSTIKCPLFQILKSTLVLFKPLLGFPGGSVVKNPPVNAGDSGDNGLTPGLGRSPGGGNSTWQTATHSSILAWGVLWMEEPGGLLSMGLDRVGHDWSDLTLAYSILAWKIPWTEESTVHGSQRIGHGWAPEHTHKPPLLCFSSWIQFLQIELCLWSVLCFNGDFSHFKVYYSFQRRKVFIQRLLKAIYLIPHSILTIQ